MSNEEILELISGLDYIGNLPTVPDLGKPIEIQVSTTRQIPLEQNKEVQTKIKEIIYNNLYDTLIDELKGTISRFQAKYNIQEINPYGYTSEPRRSSIPLPTPQKINKKNT